MSQKKIPFKPNYIYHIWTHANGSENLFREEDNYRYFLEKYGEYIHPVAETFAYCLMPNHLHLMIRVKLQESVLEYARIKKGDPTLQGFETLGGFSNYISQQFSHLFNSYTQAYNNRYDRKGSLFMSNFERSLVDSNEYFAHLIAYIHNNAVHHGFVEDLNNWPHSSWHTYFSEKKTKINKTEGLAMFGGAEAFKEVHRQINMDKLNSVFEV